MFIAFRELGTTGMTREGQQFIGAICLEDWSVGVMKYRENLQIPVRLVTPLSNAPELHYSIIPKFRHSSASNSPVLREKELRIQSEKFQLA